MKIVKKVLVLLILAAMLSGAALAAGNPYTYTVRIYSGGQGLIDGQEFVVYDNLRYGDRVTLNLRSVQLSDDSKYYVRGIRESGKDNNTVGRTSFEVTRDQDYVIAYGILGDAVAYTIRYLDLFGNELAPSETYYGNVGDKPVIAFLYIDGYEPLYYNLTKTLCDNAAENIFEFYYSAVLEPVEEEGSGVIVIQGGGNGSGAGDGTGEGPGGGEELPGSVPGSRPTPTLRPGGGSASGSVPEEILDLDPPLAGPEGENGGAETGGDRGLFGDLPPWAVIGGACAVVAIGALILILLLRKRKKKDER